jgi:hypothetical protein
MPIEGGLLINLGPHDERMPDVRHTDINVANPSTPQQRIDAGHRQADGEVTDDEAVAKLRVSAKGTQMGDDSRLWWAVTYEVEPKPHR